MAKTFTPLISLPVPIQQCSALLPNQMQCWKAATYQVVETTQTTDENSNTTTQVREYQLCSYHSVLEEQAASVDDSSLAPTPAPSSPVTKAS